MATASRDRLIHVFDVKDDYQFLRTLDEHSAAITSVKFACTSVCVCVHVCISLGLEEVIRLQLSLSPLCVQLGKTTTFNSSAAGQTNPSSSETLKMCVPLYTHSSKVYCVILLFSLVLLRIVHSATLVPLLPSMQSAGSSPPNFQLSSHIAGKATLFDMVIDVTG